MTNDPLIPGRFSEVAKEIVLLRARLREADARYAELSERAERWRVALERIRSDSTDPGCGNGESCRTSAPSDSGIWCDRCIAAAALDAGKETPK